MKVMVLCKNKKKNRLFLMTIMMIMDHDDDDDYIEEKLVFVFFFCISYHIILKKIGTSYKANMQWHKSQIQVREMSKESNKKKPKEPVNINVKKK